MTTEIEIFEVGPAHPEDVASYHHDRKAALQQAKSKSENWHTVVFVWRYRVLMPSTAQDLTRLMNATGQLDRPRWWKGRPARLASFDRGKQGD